MPLILFAVVGGPTTITAWFVGCLDFLDGTRHEGRRIQGSRVGVIKSFVVGVVVAVVETLFLFRSFPFLGGTALVALVVSSRLFWWWDG